MNCENHPDREGVAACVSCGKVICGECRLKLAGKNYCQECADELVDGKQNTMKSQNKQLKKHIWNVKQNVNPNLKANHMNENILRGMPQPRKEEAPKKSNTFLLFCVAFLVALIIVGVILYAAYIIYLAPQYGDINSLINQILNNPRGVINSLGF